MRARIVLSCQEDRSNGEIAQHLRVTPQTVSKWRTRFVQQRVDGLLDAPRAGAPRSIDDARIDAVIAKTLESVPTGATVKFSRMETVADFTSMDWTTPEHTSSVWVSAASVTGSNTAPFAAPLSDTSMRWRK